MRRRDVCGENGVPVVCLTTASSARVRDNASGPGVGFRGAHAER